MMAMAPDPGMEVGTITEAARKQYGLDPTLTGALITQVRPNSEASYFGVKRGRRHHHDGQNTRRESGRRS